MHVFTPFVINGMRVKNRFVRSATAEGLCLPDGSVTDRLETTMKELSVGGVGLVISGHAYVEKRGQAHQGQLGVHTPAMEPGIARLARAVHGYGGRFVVQLAHAGCQATATVTGETPVGPSAPATPETPSCQAMFDSLTDRLDDVFRKIRGHTRLTEENVQAALREVRLALLEADVNFKVVKDFVERVRERAMNWSRVFFVSTSHLM